MVLFVILSQCIVELVDYVFERGFSFNVSAVGQSSSL